MSSINFSKLLSQAGNLIQHISRAYGHRSQLASLEAIEARQQLTKICVLGFGALLLGILVMFLCAVAIAAWIWPMEHRIQILCLVTTLAALGATLAGMVAWRRLESWSPWPETRRQLHEDCATLGDLFTETNPNSAR